MPTDRMSTNAIQHKIMYKEAKNSNTINRDDLDIMNIINEYYLRPCLIRNYKVKKDSKLKVLRNENKKARHNIKHGELHHHGHDEHEHDVHGHDEHLINKESDPHIK